jgi:hypothetical protein
MLCVILILNTREENKQGISSSVFNDIAAEEKGTAFTRFSYWLEQFNDSHVKAYQSFLQYEHEKQPLPVIEKADYKMINLVVASAAGQPRYGVLDTTTITLAQTIDELMALMKDISNFEDKTKSSEDSKIQRKQFSKEMQALLQKYNVLNERFNKQFVTMKIDKSKEQQQIYLEQGRFIQAAQEEVSYQFSKFSDMIANFSADDLNLRELSYTDVNKIYIGSHDSVLKYNQWLSNKKQVDEEILDNELAEKSIKSMIEATAKLDQALNDIVNYLNHVQEEPSFKAVTSETKLTELKLLQNYLQAQSNFRQAITMANLSFK